MFMCTRVSVICTHECLFPYGLEEGVLGTGAIGGGCKVRDVDTRK